MNARIGSFYLLGAVVLVSAAALLRPVGWILLWPGISLALVAAGYCGLGPAIYGKRAGCLHPLSRLLHHFTLQGHELSRRHYAKQCATWDELAPGLLIGRQLQPKETAGLIDAGLTSVLDLTAEFSEPDQLRQMDYLSIPVLDLTAPSMEQLKRALTFIDHSIGSGGTIYIHCKIGFSRTAAVAGSYLVHAGNAADADAAIAQLRFVRPSIVIRPEAEATIRCFAAQCQIS
jgi:protein phosphatase